MKAHTVPELLASLAREEEVNDRNAQIACDTIAGLSLENDTLRGLLGNSAKDCIYCGLPAAEQGRCKSGFPGCSRADDQQLGEYFASGYEAECLRKENALLIVQVAVMTGTADRILKDIILSKQDSEYYQRLLLVYAGWLAETVENLPAESDKLMRLVAAIDELLVWDKATAAGVSKPYTAFNADQTLVGIIKKLRDLRGEGK